jgi:undecaprenyl-diphosphatase
MTEVKNPAGESANSAARTRQRILALFLPVAAVLYISAEALSPKGTPGGLGAIEAALVAGLTGIGVPPGPAVSAVLTYRLATYWLPVLPGWLSLRFLQKRQYV